jgi:hypothetical protein
VGGPDWTESAIFAISPRPPFIENDGPGAQVAQLVEHATENRSVGGSIPPLGTTASFP